MQALVPTAPGARRTSAPGRAWTRDREAEHFAAAVLGSPTLLEAVFARFLRVEETGVAVIFSRRIYRRRVGDEMSAWLARHGPPADEALMGWTGIPALAALRALPQAR